MQRGTVTVVSPSGVDHYRLNGADSVQTVGEAVARSFPSGFDGLIKVGTSPAANLEDLEQTPLRVGDVIVLLEGQVASGGFKGQGSVTKGAFR